MKRESNFWISERKLEATIERIIAHELGHAVCALSQGARRVKLQVAVRFPGNGIKFRGSVTHPPELNKMKDAAIGFAGILAECIWKDELDPFSYFEKVRLERAISKGDSKSIKGIESSRWHLAFLRALECVESNWELITTTVAILREQFFEQDTQRLVVYYDQELLKTSRPKSIADSTNTTR